MIVSASLLVSWRDGVTASADGEGTIVVHGPDARTSLRQVPVAIAEVLLSLDPPGVALDRIGQLVDGNASALAQCHYNFERLTQRGLLCYRAQLGEDCLATIVAVSPTFKSRAARVDADRRYILSRFALMRRQGNDAVLESPLAQARIILNDCRSAALVGVLATPTTAAEVAERMPGFGVDAITSVMMLLERAGMIDDEDTEDQASALQTWEFHDLLFHARTRWGRFDAGYGGTYRLTDRMPPPPALKPAVAGEAFDLYRPDMEALEREDRPLAWVQSHRRSIREFDSERPITNGQLGEFLYRVARVTHFSEHNVQTPSGPIRQEFAARPYPAGGGLYELEVYAAVQRCSGLTPGLYYYDPARHRLVRLCGQTTDVSGLLREAAESTGAPAETLQVLLILAARFPRLAWKYESIAYALTLKHVGVLYQTMYLTATAMGLTPCAVGGGNADLFARAAGTDYYAETSVGEFLLGSPRP
jgi:SagB-type dehydrogenase family enzyme